MSAALFLRNERSTSNASVPVQQEKLYKVRRDELPLSCPTNEMALWNSHPRVYLPIEAEKDVTCPYCGARYILEE